MLSAQTTDASVNRVTPALFAAYPDAEHLAAADLEDVEDKLKRLGLYRTKARNIIALSQALQETFSGQVPQTYKELQSLPGVGRKTANVVRSVAFGIPSLAVDTHVDRVSKRLGLAKPADSVEKVEEKLKRKLPRERWNQAHLDLIFWPLPVYGPQPEMCRVPLWLHLQKEAAGSLADPAEGESP